MHATEKENLDRIRESAISGNAENAWRVACGYFDGYLFFGDGICIRLRKNPRAGLRWLKRAALSGSSDAMIDLGGHLSSGEFCEIDLPLALKWEKKAFEQGNENAAHNIAITYSLMSKRKECYQWLLKSLEGGYDASLCLVGVCLYMGHGVRRHLAKAHAKFRASYKSDRTWEGDRVKALKFINMIAHGRMLFCDSIISRLEPENIYDDLALKTFSRERKIVRNNMATSFCLGEALLRMNRAKRGIPYLYQCFTQGFCKHESMLLLSEIFQLLKMREDEISLYRFWLRDHPQDGFILGNLGAVYLDQDRFKDSLDVSLKAVQLVKGDKRWIRRNIRAAQTGLGKILGSGS